jgi:hypothetical protein
MLIWKYLLSLLLNWYLLREFSCGSSGIDWIHAVITFYGEELLAPHLTPICRTIPHLLSASAYSLYSQLPSISWSGFNSCQVQWWDFLLFITVSRLALEPAQTPIQWVQWVKWLGCEADHSPPSSAEVKNVWSYTFIPQYAFMAWCLIKQEVLLHDVLLS